MNIMKVPTFSEVQTYLANQANVTTIPSLGGRTTFKVMKGDDEVLILVNNSGNSFEIDASHFSYIGARVSWMMSNDPGNARKTKYYNQPEFDALNLIADPYLAGFIIHLMDN